MTLMIRVIVEDDNSEIANYVMNHDDLKQRRVLGEQCRAAFEAGQSVFTIPNDFFEEEPQCASTLISPASSALSLMPTAP